MANPVYVLISAILSLIAVYQYFSPDIYSNVINTPDSIFIIIIPFVWQDFFDCLLNYTYTK